MEHEYTEQDALEPGAVAMPIEDGRWFVWAGICAVSLGWIGAAGIVVSSVGIEGLLNLPIQPTAGTFLLGLATSIVLITAGVLGQEMVRSRAANALVLQASRELLSPAEQSAEKIDNLGWSISRMLRGMNTNIGETRGQLETVNTDLMRTLSVTAKAVKAVQMTSKDLIGGIEKQRTGLENCRAAMREDVEAATSAVHTHAELVARASNQARSNIESAEGVLQSRVDAMDAAAERLAGRIKGLDEMAAQGRKRTMALIYALSRINDQMDASSKNVRAAIKAGDLAAEASKGTADSMVSAVSTALQRALQASESIKVSSAAAQQEAEQALNRLTEAGSKLELIAQAARGASDTQAAAIEVRLQKLSDMIVQAAERAAQTAEAGLERTRARIEQTVAEPFEDNVDPSTAVRAEGAQVNEQISPAGDPSPTQADHMLDDQVLPSEDTLAASEDGLAWRSLMADLDLQMTEIEDLFPSLSKNASLRKLMKIDGAEAQATPAPAEASVPEPNLDDAPSKA
ncbi:MAG: hypothetical protein AAFW65_03100 [Pseudomonadota bacterium]